VSGRCKSFAFFICYICVVNEIIQHIRKFIAIDDAEAEIILSYFETENFRKKSLLLEDGQTSNKQFFIVKGLVRFYIINDKGAEQTIQFGIENWWITDYLSFQYQTASHFYIQAIENLEVLSIDRKSFDELLDRIPKLEKYFRLVIQKSFGASQIRIRYLFTMSAEERYNNINTQFPEFVQRVPQYMLASYLDFSAEFMSKIRAGKV